MKAFLKKQSWRVRWAFDVPAYVNFKNDQQKNIDARIAIFDKLAYKAGLKYPVLLKAKAGQALEHSHTFYCANN